jgi:hypothetical protein
LGTPNGLREPVWCGLRGGGDEESFVWVRGVEAGRAGTEKGGETVPVDVRVGIVGLETLVEKG